MGTAYLPVSIILLLSSFCKSDEQLTHARPLSPGETLISKGGIFALGFFSPTSSNRSLYLGIWYHSIPVRTVVWIANRDNPIITPSSTKLVITNSSDLVLSDSQGRTLWATMNNITAGGVGASAVLLNTGNLVLQLPNGTDIWQSFDHPTDTFLPGSKMWTNYKTHIALRIVAWKGSQDPSTGNFSLSGDPSSGFQILIWHGTSPYWRTEVWYGATPSSLTATAWYGVVWSHIVDDGKEISATFNAAEGSQRTHWKLDYTGNVMFRSWNNQSSSWTVVFEVPGNGCLLYGSCGPFGYCDSTGDIPECKCLDGFEPAGGFNLNFSRGCLRKEALKCGGEDQFLTLPGMKVPDKFLYGLNRSFEECAAECNRNCSCTAYAYHLSRCLVWMGELVDTQKASNTGENLYLRLARSPGHNSAVNKKKSSMVIKIVLPIISYLLILACIYLVSICKSRGKRRNKETLKRPVLGHLSTYHELWDQNLEFSCVSFEDIAAATNSFHDANMLGKGGFGNVYKGTLEDGKEVAVKRLSKGSEQGIEHFRNEVVLIAKLQHKNLVRLLGCCIREDEKLLIYEYLPNKSLDKYLFDDARKSMLDWATRFNIIKGVARGLLYLHQDSRMKIIHRDLKASNILLDEEMNPKISDFGMARIFGGNEQEASTKRVVGTYGYMSPEYAMEGIFSVKTDTYSFGILVLEIVSGLKISSPHHLVMDFPNLIAYAWKLWTDGKARDFVDTSVLESYSFSEVFQCIHMGLLCVQDSPNARPLMSVVVSMLDNEAIPRPMPKQPMYFAQRNYGAEEAREDLENSVNNASLTTLEGR